MESRPETFTPSRMTGRRTDWSGYEMTDAMLERAWERQDSHDQLWEMARTSGYLAEACRRYREKRPEVVRPAGLRPVPGMKPSASSADS